MTTIAPDRSAERPPAPDPDGRPTPPDPDAGRRPGGWRRMPAERVALLALLAGTAVLYLWDLGASGWANSFYAAAAQAGSESWKAFFFGSSDAAGSITVDKPPLSLWPMALSIRLFGLSSWSLLVPQALMGVASVGLLHAAVRRATGSAWAGLAAGLVLALTPVAALMFRFDNPDALLVLLMTGAAAAVIRAVDAERALRWVVLAGVLLGLAFLTKTLQSFLVLPGLGLAYLLFAATTWRKRIGHLVAGLAAMVVAAGWWVAIVELWPAGSRPYIGGSQDNDFLELTFGYNGFGRLTGDETGSVGGGGGGTGGGMWGTTGIWRMFGSESGGQIAWLMPAALVFGVCALVWGTRRVRAAATLLLGWLVVTALTFSFMAGIYHAYYTVALAPAIAGLVAVGGSVLWRRRTSLPALAIAAATVAMTTSLAFVILARTPDWHPWLRYTIAVVGFATAFALVFTRLLPRRVAGAVAAGAMLAVLAGPAAYALSTAATPHTGSIVTAGPSSSGQGGPGGMPGGGMRGGAMPGGTTGGPGGTGGFPGTTTQGGTTTPGGTGSVGGLLDGSTPSSSLTALLEADADSYTWVAATVGSNSASGYQLATQDSVMPIGGFNGSDPSPTLAQFEQWVSEGTIHYFIAGGGSLGGGMGGSSSGTASQITSWVEANYTAQTVDGVTLYDLTS